MSKNWSRIALASFLVLLLGASAAFATTARVRSLANAGDYMSDDSNVNRWYSTLTSYANQVNAEMGTWDPINFGYSGTHGLSWINACGEDGKWGTYRISLNESSLNAPGSWIGNRFYRDHSPMDGSIIPVIGTAVFAETPLNRWDLAGGWDLGENMALGIAVTQSKWKAKDTVGIANQFDTAEISDSWMTLGAGFTWTNNDNMVFDVLANFGTAGGKYTSSLTTGGNTVTTTAEWDAKTAFDIGARLFYDWKDDVALVPMAEFATSDYSIKYSDNSGANPPLANPVPNGQKTTDFMFGLGINKDVNQDNMLVFALEVMNRTEKDSKTDSTSVEYTSLYLPTFRLALESHITSWLTTRVGAAKHLLNEKAKYNDGERQAGVGTPATVNPPTGGPSGFEWFLGCGFNVAEWTVDLELAQETPFALGYWLTGYSGYGAGGPVGRISAVYNY